MRGAGIDSTFRAVDYIGILRESLSRIDLTDAKRRRAIYDRVVEGFERIIEGAESQMFMETTERRIVVFYVWPSGYWSATYAPKSTFSMRPIAPRK